MFTSNQLLSISGELSEMRVYNALVFALNLSGNLESFLEGNLRCVYQITDDNKYCIGWAYSTLQKGWKEFDFKFNLKDITKSIINHLSDQEIDEDVWDGLYKKGFCMEAVPESMSDEFDKIKNPFYGLVSFKAFTCFYSK